MPEHDEEPAASPHADSAAAPPANADAVIFSKPLGHAMILCLGVFCGGLAVRAVTPDSRQLLENYRLYLAANVTLAILICAAIVFLGKLLAKPAPRSVCINWLVEHTQWIERLPVGRMPLWIALAAGLGVYAELIVIRTQASYLTLFAHFKNLSLMSSFLGLGLGYAQPGKRLVTTPLFLPALCAQILLLALFHAFDVGRFLEHPIREELRMGLADAGQLADVVAYYGFICFFFLFNAMCFMPLGHLAARLMGRLTALQAYSYNLIGSLAAIVVVTALSFLWTPPVIWLSILAIGVGTCLFGQKSTFRLTLISSCLLLATVALPQRLFQVEIYSPYQLLALVLDHECPTVECNGTWLQHIIDFSPERVKSKDYLKRWQPYYEMPYLFKPNPEDVLIVGAGTGNDVAAAIRHGAKQIDAVELDPAIVALGRQLHPEYPYQQPNVHVYVNDARNFIKYSKKKYDLIVYGLLDDSHIMSATSGGIRSDSYVYTVEACREARALLKPEGLISMTVCTQARLACKVYKMLEAAFDGSMPVAYWTQYDDGHCFIAGEHVPQPVSKPPFDEITATCKADSVAADMCTDDWPFVWTYRRIYPVSYLLVIAVILTLSLFFIRQMTPKSEAKPSWPCFFLGAGFMLIETKGITELALYFGSTWFVTTIVIFAILLLALLANVLVLKVGRKINSGTAYALLILTILAGMNLSHASFGNQIIDCLVMTLLVTGPLFFSGFAFSEQLLRVESVGQALYSNLLGGMLGGFLEYNSMYFGLNSLYVFALALYVLAWLTGSGLQVRSAVDLSPKTPT